MVEERSQYIEKPLNQLIGEKIPFTDKTQSIANNNNKEQPVLTYAAKYMNEKQAKSSEKIRVNPKDQYVTKTPIQANNANSNANTSANANTNANANANTSANANVSVKKIISTSSGVINKSYSNTPTRMMITDCDENFVKKEFNNSELSRSNSYSIRRGSTISAKPAEIFVNNQAVQNSQPPLMNHESAEIEKLRKDNKELIGESFISP